MYCVAPSTEWECNVCWVKCKCRILRCWRILQKILHPDTEADDYQNLTSSSLFTDTSRVKFSWRSDQQFLRKFANRQTNKRRVKHNLFGEGNDRPHISYSFINSIMAIIFCIFEILISKVLRQPITTFIMFETAV